MQQRMRKVLIVPSGTEIGLEAHEALVRRRDLELVGAESTDNSHASFVFRRNYRIPPFDGPDFAGSVGAIVRSEGISYILPAHDDVQLQLLQSGASVGCPILSSPVETVEITRFKSRTYAVLAGAVPVPHHWSAENPPPRGLPFPVFVKPDRGQGSQNTFLCRTPQELHAVLHANSGMVICEYLPGREVTVDCFSDRERGLLLAEPRLRVRTRAGISVRSVAIAIPEARSHALAISGRLALHGTWFFQLKERSEGDWVLLEVGARLPGGATFQRMKGINLALLMIHEQERMPLELITYPLDVVMDRAFISRFAFKVDYDTLYVDFDDTLCIKGAPNLDLTALLVEARHRGKRLVLLTRNSGKCADWLEQHGIAGLFHQVTLLDRQAPKAAFLDSRSILVDDSFAERKACHEAGRLCVDSDVASALITQLQKS
jgi:hypothetical protein